MLTPYGRFAAVVAYVAVIATVGLGTVAMIAADLHALVTP